MKLLMLGSTGYHPNDRRHTACFMLPQLGVVLDAGTGFFRVRDHLQTDTLDIFLSHAHLDHIFGLTFLFDVLYQKTMERVTVHAEACKLAAIQTHLLAADLFPVPLPCEYRPLTEPIALPEGSRLTYFSLEHPGGSIGFRIDGPSCSLAYVTDTTARADSPYVEQIRGVDTLIHECYFPDGYEALADKTGHSCASPVAQLAKAAAVKQLVLVHVNPLSLDEDPIGLDGVKKIFPNSLIGVDGMELDI
jgi:ribonuclease BN (tRNA processing enzyme)